MNAPDPDRLDDRDDPLALVRDALARAALREPTDATAMTLATVDAAGRPSARMVLLKGIDDRGFVFYTNYGGRKAKDLAANPRAALCLHWAKGEEQVRVEGVVERVTDAESDAYFASRPRGSQIAAWASEQSAPIASRAELEARVRELEARFAGKDVPRPPFWGGYRVVPDRIELWWGRPSRLHDRVVFVREGTGFRVERLSP
jgi:pyridoxamine 5'-phosphate oxidase